MAVKNAAPFTVAVNSLELRITVPAAHDASAGHSAGTNFESRVVQETGTH